MKFKTTYIFILAISFLGNCAELFNSGNKGNNEEILLLALAAGQRCPTSAVTTPKSGTKYDFENCSGDANLLLAGSGFTSQNVTLSGGLVGTGNTSTIFTNGSAIVSEGGNKKASIEIVYRLNSGSSTISALLPATGNFNGPGFLIGTTSAQKVADGTASAFGGTAAGPWASSLNVDKTLCLEVHEEGAGAHIFGWQGACAFANPGTYEFEEEDVAIPSGFGGDKVALRINGATIKSITIFREPIGSAGIFR